MASSAWRAVRESSAWRTVCRELAGEAGERAARRSTSCGLPLFWGFAGERIFHGGGGSGKARRRGNDVGNGRGGIREKGGERVDQTAHDFRGRQRRRLQRLVVIEHPAGEQRFGRLLDPLIDQNGNFLAQVGGMVEAREFKTLQGRARRGLQVIEGRSEARNGHGQSSDLKGLGRESQPVKSLMNCTKLSRIVSSPPVDMLWITRAARKGCGEAGYVTKGKIMLLLPFSGLGIVGGSESRRVTLAKRRN